MQSETSARTSFFDDDDLNLKFEFVKPEKSHLKYLNVSPSLKTALTRADTSEKGVYALHERILAFYEVPQSSHLFLPSLDFKLQNSPKCLRSWPLKNQCSFSRTRRDCPLFLCHKKWKYL